MNKERKELISNIIKSLEPHYSCLTSSNMIKYGAQRHITYIPKIIKEENIQNILNIINKTQETNLIIEYKLDGILINITYLHGKLVSIITKGNREGGRDYTDILIHHPHIPITIQHTLLLEIRCEIIMSKNIYDKKYQKYGIDIRSVISGFFNKKHITSEFLNDIVIVAYDCSLITKQQNYNNIQTHTSFYKFCHTQKINIVAYENITLAELEKKILLYKEQTEKYMFPCDGIIIKYNSIQTHINILNKNHKISKYIIANKFNRYYTTNVTNIKFTISKDGNILPIVHIHTINCDDKKCNKLTLYSLDILQKERININSNIVVKYNTNFVYHANKDQTSQITMVQNCPFCHSKITNIGKKYYCFNARCIMKNIAILYSYIKTKKISSIGKETIKLLFQHNIIEHAVDLLNPQTINKIQTILIEVKTYSTKKINNIITGINYLKRNISIVDIILLMGIPSIGQETVKKINLLNYDFQSFQLQCLMLNNTLTKAQKENYQQFIQQNNHVITKIENIIQHIKHEYNK